MLKLAFIFCYLSYLFLLSETSSCAIWNYDYTIRPLSVNSLDSHFEINTVDIGLYPHNWSPDVRITCSDVSADIMLNYEYEDRPYSQDLFIVNSTIPKIPANSSISRFTHLRTLYLKFLKIEEISPGAFNGLVVDEELNLGSNKLTKISTGIFNNLITLQTLDLSTNSISEIEKDCFLGLTNLRTLHIQENRITVLDKNLFKDLGKLERLWISHNPIIEFPSEINLPSLVSFLDIGTNLKRLSFDWSGNNMELLKITEGQLEEVDFAKFPKNVRNIHLDRNNLNSIKNWEKLNGDFVFLRSNKIPVLEIPDNVRYIYMSHNFVRSIKSIVPKQTKKLEFLDLSYNKVDDITFESFFSLSNLKTLDLKHNKITVLHGNTFFNCSSLRQLDLSYNEIETIEADAFKGVSPGSIILSNNKLKSLRPPSLTELPWGTVDLNHNQVNWEDLKAILKSNKNITVGVDPSSWICEKVEEDSDVDIRNLRYLKANIVKQITCNAVIN